MPVSQIKLARVPEQIDFSDLVEKERLIAKAEIPALRDALSRSKETPPTRYSKEEMGRLLGSDKPYKYGLFHDANGEMYAVYFGNQQSKAIGSGAFGTVKCAQNIETGQWMVLKTQLLENPADQVNIREEKKQVDKAYATDKTESGIAYRQSKKMKKYKKRDAQTANFIMPYVWGIDLNKLVNEKKDTLTPTRVLEIITQLAIHLQVVHQTKRLLHRDIKLANAMYDFTSNTANYVDFGLSRAMLNTLSAYYSTKTAGSPGFMAPEITPSLLREQPQYLFNLEEIKQKGVARKTMAELSQDPTFSREQLLEIQETLLSCAPDSPIYQYTAASDIYAFGKLCQVLLKRAPQHDYLVEDGALHDMVQHMLSIDPKARPTLL